MGVDQIAAAGHFANPLGQELAESDDDADVRAERFQFRHSFGLSDVLGTKERDALTKGNR